jgi:hypothetical protein
MSLLEKILDHLPQLLFLLVFLGPGILSAIVQNKKRKAASGPRPPGAPPEPVPMSDLEERVRRNFEELLRKRAAGESGSGSARSTPAPKTTPPPLPSAPAPSGSPATPVGTRRAPSASRTRPVAGSARRPAPEPDEEASAAAHAARQREPAVAPSIQELARDSVYFDPTTSEAYHVEESKSSKIHDGAYTIDNSQAFAYDFEAYKAERKTPVLRSARQLIPRGKLDRQSMRRALLLKEILDRPVSLRSRSEPWEETF